LERFAYVVAHDLKEPLRMVDGYIQLARRRASDELPDETDEFLAFAQQGAERMQTLIHDILRYSTAARGQAGTDATSADEAVEDVLTDLAATIQARGAEVIHEGLPYVECNARQLRQLFANLIGNAVRYADRPDPEVRIWATRHGDMIHFVVADNGPGIEPEDRERIFEPFQKLDRGAGDGGSGLGMAICQRIVERHGGRIWVEERSVPGARIHFELPAAPRAVPPPVASSEPSQEEATPDAERSADTARSA
ncbi:MAG: ATP-binding protein, partial [Candidatus Thermoplasmatota archaeon]|nr:ATP-binding protein [Candidatus Thermoplasmatota archaeon]